MKSGETLLPMGKNLATKILRLSFDLAMRTFTAEISRFWPAYPTDFGEKTEWRRTQSSANCSLKEVPGIREKYRESPRF
jgi:hypothetical protein